MTKELQQLAMAKFAPEFVRKRMIGFEKDMRICLTSVSHPTEPRSTVAFFPALMLCCATLDYLACLYRGQMRKGGANVPMLTAYAQSYLPQPAYDSDVIRVLRESLRHSIAHQDIAAGVWIDQHSLQQGRRISWYITTDSHGLGIKVVEEPGEADRSPWPCHFTHRSHVHIGALWRDIRDSANSYARKLECSPDLISKFSNCMESLFPPT